MINEDFYESRDVKFKFDNFTKFKLEPDSSLVRGDIIRFKYTSKQEDSKKINLDPCIIVSGVNMSEGWIEGPNVFLFNNNYSTDGKIRESNRNSGVKFLQMYETRYWNKRKVNEDSERLPYLPFVYKNMEKLFGPLGLDLKRYWRRYDMRKVTFATKLNMETTKLLLNSNNPTFVNSTIKIKE